MARKGLNIYKRKDGRWEGRYIKGRTSAGKAHYGYLYDHSYGELRKRLLEVEADTEAGRRQAQLPKVRFDTILDLWLQAEHSRVKESTLSCYFRHIQNHIRPKLGEIPLSKLNTTLLDEYAYYLLSHGRLDGNGGLGAKTISDIFAIIKSAIKYGQYAGYPIQCPINRPSAKTRDREMRVLSTAEQKSLEQTLLTNTNRSKFGVLMCLYTGLRLGELCALTWDCFDVQQGVLLVRETLQRIPATSESDLKTKIVITRPKSLCSLRKIPLPQHIVELAKGFMAAPKAFVLTGRVGQFMEPRTLQYRFSTYIKESGIAHTNFHALRHTFATRCVENGFDIKSLSEILGHANVNITLNRYVHSSFDLKRANMSKLSLISNY